MYRDVIGFVRAKTYAYQSLNLTNGNDVTLYVLSMLPVVKLFVEWQFRVLRKNRNDSIDYINIQFLANIILDSMFKIKIFNLNESVLNWFACSFCVIAENEDALNNKHLLIFLRSKKVQAHHILRVLRLLKNSRR